MKSYLPLVLLFLGLTAAWNQIPAASTSEDGTETPDSHVAPYEGLSQKLTQIERKLRTLDDLENSLSYGDADHQLSYTNTNENLENRRQTITSDMYKLMYQVSGFFTELERASKYETIERELQIQLDHMATHTNSAEMANLKARRSTLEAELQGVTQLLNDLRNNVIRPNLKSVDGDDLDMETIQVTEGFRRILESKVQEILTKTDELSVNGSAVTYLTNTSSVSQKFKEKISWIFAALVGLVIVGFFVVAGNDPKIRGTIFSGDTGIQFLTLFSIVIAIILFGITGVLEGKEISALIGGISGYILGRSSLKTPSTKETELPKESDA